MKDPHGAFTGDSSFTARLSLCVDDPAISEVIDTDSGECLPTRQVLGDVYEYLIRLRWEAYERMLADNPRFLCALCHTPVYIVRRCTEQRFFFRHRLDEERCSAKTRGALSEAQINARKYNGIKEGLPHIRMKELIAESLACDPRFSNVRVETVVRGAAGGEWRKPDVSAMYEGSPIYFEAQLSTTFLRVMVERRDFYLRNGGTLCWIFGDFMPESRRLLHDDVFYTNNRNIFIVNDETLHESRTRKSFVMQCRWLPPVRRGNRIAGDWHEGFVQFSELTVDQEHQRIFYFDCDGERNRLHNELSRPAWSRRFEQYWVDESQGGPDVGRAWLIARNGLVVDGGPILPRFPNEPNALRALLNGLYSAKYGRCIGWRFTSLVQVAHRLVGCAPWALPIFLRALIFYGRADRLAAEDRTGKWKDKVNRTKGGANEAAASDGQFHKYDGITRYLFPELYD